MSNAYTSLKRLHSSPKADASAKAKKRWQKKLRKARKPAKPDRKFCRVYGLMDYTGKIRYIGQTRCTLESRLKLHFEEASKNPKPALAQWLNGTYNVEIVMIDDNATWDVSEILWIDRYKRDGADLLNVLRGGGDTLHAVKREGLLT